MKRRAARRATDDGGFTLVEIVTAVMLLGLAGTIIMGGLFTVVRTSRINTDQARVEAVLSSAVDRITAWTYVPCPPASGSGSYLDVVQPAAATVNWPASTVSIVELKYYDPTSGSWIGSNNISGGCNPSVSATSPRTLQRILLRVQTPGGTYSRQIEVVKNNVIPANQTA